MGLGTASGGSIWRGQKRNLMDFGLIGPKWIHGNFQEETVIPSKQ